MTEKPKPENQDDPATGPDPFDYEPDELHLVEPDEPPDDQGDADSAVTPP